MKISILHFFLFAFLFSSTNFSQEVVNASFEFDGVTRDYIVFLPQSYEPNMPVVLNLHGYTDNAQWQMEYSLMNDVADTAGFIAVYPNAVWPGFNTGLIYGSWPPLHTHIDDVGFISELIDTIISVYSADKNRIYCCGYSNGGMMTLKLAVQHGHRFAAFGSVAGVLIDPILERYNVLGNLPMIFCHGTDDVLVHYNGGPYPMMWSVDETIDFWVQNNNCNPFYTSVMLPDVDTTDGCTVEKRTYKDFSNNAQIEFYRVIDGGHNPPGANPHPDYRWSNEGNINRDINFNSELWNFFKDYENHLVDMAYAESFDIYPNYIESNGGTLNINAQLVNPENHTAKVYALLNADSSAFQDSIELYDDGMHNDGDANDNYWGGSKFLSGLDIDYYNTSLYTNDLMHNTTNLYRFQSRFTTTGPIETESYTIVNISENRRGLTEFTLKNSGSEKTIEDVRARLKTSDTCVTEITLNDTYFGDIGPGESKTVAVGFAFTFSACTIVEFELEISSGGIVFWRDTLMIDVVTYISNKSSTQPNEFALMQNFPNPFNPSTKIKYELPKIENRESVIVQLIVYDILGNEIADLVNEPKPPGTYEIEFDASDFTSGIYFYSLQVYTPGRAGDFVETKKMLLIK
ncbi:MAG: prolyl oligopeptidase family serine peptidase [Ignavibacteriae bacterium]|nr:hypothetical protein [Ignavibacteriota bacterium]NOH00183.1 prolyl oligopeptidase family serine peptidase [Ignavibacteriota bacterium]